MLTPRPSKRLLVRLPDRTDIGREMSLATLGRGLPDADVAELADLIELELQLPVGLLRPEDSLHQLLAPFQVGNPLTWLWAEGALEDGVSEVNYRLRLRRRDLPERTLHSLDTVRDLFEAWCEKPAA